LLGVGTARGKKSYSNLEINDAIDFWRVEIIKQDRRLLLRAEMKLPGMAWLDFNTNGENGKCHLSILYFFSLKPYSGKPTVIFFSLFTISFLTIS
tara:strand:- start:6764 stop:7048 length:285 start_codon:yes stop_codon:yes gene_type:complete